MGNIDTTHVFLEDSHFVVSEMPITDHAHVLELSLLEEVVVYLSPTSQGTDRPVQVTNIVNIVRVF